MAAPAPREVPGARGLPLLGETLSFVADVKRFIDARVAQYGATFRTNLFRVRTIFTCSYSTGAALLLHPGADAADAAAADDAADAATAAPLDAAAAYAPFLSPLYPAPNLIIAADTTAVRAAQLALLDACLRDVAPFAARASHLTAALVRGYSERAAAAAPDAVPMSLYAAFKPLAARAIVEAVLGDTPPDQLRRVRALTAVHFNGVAAVPVSVTAFGARSARAAALDAYHQLERLLSAHLSRRVAALRQRPARAPRLAADHGCSAAVLARLVHDGAAQPKDAVQVLLTLLSPAVAKAVASTATLAVALLADARRAALQRDVAAELRLGRLALLDCVLMETLRLYPPLAGAIRSATRDTAVDGLRVESGASVWLSYMHANRDHSAFDRALQFDPSRWALARRHSDGDGGGGCPFAHVGGALRTPLSFGGGRRQCRGRDVAWEVLRRMVGGVVRALTVAGEAVRDEHMRYVPVLRPREDAVVRVRCRTVS